jgi:hypothetical protein
MIALLLAAQITAALGTQGSPAANYARPAADMLPTPNIYREPARCKDTTVQVVDRYGQPLTQRLADLPPGAIQYAVDRKIEGCRVITVVRGVVQSNQSEPTEEGHLTPLAIRPTFRMIPFKAPAMREDGPSNRR